MSSYSDHLKEPSNITPACAAEHCGGKPLEMLSIDEVEFLLQRLNFMEFSAYFRQQKIDGKQLACVECPEDIQECIKTMPKIKARALLTDINKYKELGSIPIAMISSEAKTTDIGKNSPGLLQSFTGHNVLTGPAANAVSPPLSTTHVDSAHAAVAARERVGEEKPIEKTNAMQNVMTDDKHSRRLSYQDSSAISEGELVKSSDTNNAIVPKASSADNQSTTQKLKLSAEVTVVDKTSESSSFQKEAGAAVGIMEVSESASSVEKGTPIVCDIGSETCRVGFAGEEMPRIDCPSYVARLRSFYCVNSALFDKFQEEVFFGDGIPQKGGMIFEYPIEHGVVKNWEVLEIIFRNIYRMLWVESRDHPILLTEAPFSSKVDKERITRMLFDSFHVPAVFFQEPPGLIQQYDEVGYRLQALASSMAGMKDLKISRRFSPLLGFTGLVMGCGGGVTYCVPFEDGYSYPGATSRFNLGGSDVTDNLMRLLSARAYLFTSSFEREIVKNMKELYSYVALDFDIEKKEDRYSRKESVYELPDGNCIVLTSERFICNEIFFQPSLIGKEHPGIHHTVFESIFKCDTHVREKLCANILLTGGSTATSGFAERLTQELRQLLPSSFKVSVHSPPNKQLSEWIGGSLLASDSGFLSTCLTKVKYEEEAHSKAMKNAAVHNSIPSSSRKRANATAIPSRFEPYILAAAPATKTFTTASTPMKKDPLQNDIDPPIVIDFGSGVCKAGFANDDLPSLIFPTVVGKAKNDASLHKIPPHLREEEFFIGNGTQHMMVRSHINRSYTVQRGHVTNWDQMESIWTYIFRKLSVNAVEHPVILSEAPLNCRANRERTAQVLFESFYVPAMYIESPAVLALYASGRTSGCVLGCGEDVTYCVPIYEGYAIRHAVTRLDVGARDVTEKLDKLLEEQWFGGYLNKLWDKHHFLSRMRESLSFVSLDFHRDMKVSTTSSSLEKTYELPDHTIVVSGATRFTCAESLFNLDLLYRDYSGLKLKGVHDCVYQSVMKCDTSNRKYLFENIVLSGGMTLCPGFPERLTQELTALVPSACNVNLVAPQNRQYSEWIGGSILATLSSFQNQWISKAEYDECGPEVVVRKCFDYF